MNLGASDITQPGESADPSDKASRLHESNWGRNSSEATDGIRTSEGEDSVRPSPESKEDID